MTAAIPEDYNAHGYELGGTPNIQRAWRVLAGGSERVAEALIEIAERGASEPARVAAATQVLRMVGFGNHDKVQVQIIPSQYNEAMTPGAAGMSAREQIESRMALLREPQYDPDDESGIVDAEIIDADE